MSSGHRAARHLHGSPSSALASRAVVPLAAPQTTETKSAETAASGAEEAVPQIRRAQRGHGGAKVQELTKGWE